MSRYVVQAAWSDVPHLTEQDKADLLKSLPPHQRDARSKGIPSMGSGAIYPVAEEDVFIDPIKLPDFWPRAYGLDVGWKKTAAIWAAWDRDNDIIYLYSEHYRGQAEPAVHASAIKARGSWIKGTIDSAANSPSQTDGRRLLDLYEKEGLDLIKPDKAVEAGILEVYQRLSTGRLKIFNTLQNTKMEYRIYRRNEKGRVVKENDHLMDAKRYLCMMINDIATTRPIRRTPTTSQIADTTAGY